MWGVREKSGMDPPERESGFSFASSGGDRGSWKIELGEQFEKPFRYLGKAVPLAVKAEMEIELGTTSIITNNQSHGRNWYWLQTNKSPELKRLRMKHQY